MLRNLLCEEYYLAKLLMQKNSLLSCGLSRALESLIKITKDIIKFDLVSLLLNI